MKNLKWVLGGKMSLHTQRILSKWVQRGKTIPHTQRATSKWVQSKKNTPPYPKNNKKMGTE